MKKFIYIFAPLVTMLLTTACNKCANQIIKSEITVETLANGTVVSNGSQLEVTLNASATGDVHLIDAKGFFIISGKDESEQIERVNLTGKDQFSAVVSVAPSTSYRYAAFAIDCYGMMIIGKNITFTTPSF